MTSIPSSPDWIYPRASFFELTCPSAFPRRIKSFYLYFELFLDLQVAFIYRVIYRLAVLFLGVDILFHVAAHVSAAYEICEFRSSVIEFRNIRLRD